MSTHGVKKGIKTTGLHHKQEIYNTARCLETAFYTLTRNVLISPLYFNFNLNNFSNIINHLSKKLMFIRLPFANIRYAACVL
jgi:hypothetical protein